MKKDREKALIPNYYKDFNCIGGACEDTCCAGWALPVDESTYKRYKKVKDPVMKKRLDKELVAKKGNQDPENAAKIKLKNNKCAFLTGDGWCDIYVQLGEHYLSSSCKRYPRTMNKVADRIEYSLAPSCPEAARQILLRPEGIVFEEGETDAKEIYISGNIKINLQNPKEWKDYLLSLRKMLFNVLQRRELNIEERFLQVETILKAVEQTIEKGQIKKIPSLLNQPLGQVRTERSGVMKETEEMLELALRIKQMFNEKKPRMKQYNDCFQEMLEGLRLNEEQVTEESKDAYEKALKMYYVPFLEKKGYMLENYFVNYIFERCMPLDGRTPLESFKRMMFYYHLIKLHLIGMASTKEALDEKMVVKFIQGFTKTYDHGEPYIEKLIKLI